MLKKLLFVLLVSVFFAVPVHAQEANRISYTMAVRNATRDLPAVTTIEAQIAGLEVERDQYRSGLEELRAAGGLTRQMEATIQVKIDDRSAEIVKLRHDRDIERIKTENKLRKELIAIENTKLKIQLLEAVIELERTRLHIAGLRFDAGFISEAELKEIELELAANESNLAALLIQLEIDHQNLNNTMQRPATGNFQVVFERELIELPEDIDRHIRRNVPNQPNIRKLNLDYDIAQARLGTVPTPGPERTELERARNRVERLRNEATRSLEAAMRNQYNYLEGLLHQNEFLEVNRQQFIELLEVTEIQYQTGLATRFEKEEFELAILKAEIEIEQNLNNFWSGQFEFEHPFLIAG